MYGKQHHNKFTCSASRARQSLDLIHYDIAEVSNVVSYGGNKYVLTFTDDYSRFTWVYILQHKSQVLDMFHKFKLMVENETNHRIKVFRLDNGGEYISHAFTKYLDDNGIK